MVFWISLYTVLFLIIISLKIFFLKLDEQLFKEIVLVIFKVLSIPNYYLTVQKDRATAGVLNRW